MHRLQARIKEVNIGKVQNAMQTLEQLGKMSREVSRTILNKAEALGSRKLETLGYIDIISRQMETSILESIDKMEKMILFEVDNVILDGDFLDNACMQLGLSRKLEEVRTLYPERKEQLRAVAGLFKGTSLPELMDIANDMPLVDGVRQTIADLKKQGYFCGIVSEQFSGVASHLK